MAETLATMPAERSFVVHGAAGWDEATPIGPFICFDVRGGRVRRSVRDPADVGLPRCTETDLRGGDAAENALRLRDALAGQDTAAHRDALILGAALALEVTGREASPKAAVARARAAIDAGEGSALLERLDAFGAHFK
jgi:anthranilate phosphoribosyltransferase